MEKPPPILKIEKHIKDTFPIVINIFDVLKHLFDILNNFFFKNYAQFVPASALNRYQKWRFRQDMSSIS